MATWDKNEIRKRLAARGIDLGDALSEVTYREKTGSRMVNHLEPGDSVMCAVRDGVEEWRDVVETITAMGMDTVVVLIADETETGTVSVSLKPDLVVRCRPAFVAIEGGADDAPPENDHEPKDLRAYAAKRGIRIKDRNGR